MMMNKLEFTMFCKPNPQSLPRVALLHCCNSVVYANFNSVMLRWKSFLCCISQFSANLHKISFHILSVLFVYFCYYASNSRNTDCLFYDLQKTFRFELLCIIQLNIHILQQKPYFKKSTFKVRKIRIAIDSYLLNIGNV